MNTFLTTCFSLIENEQAVASSHLKPTPYVQPFYSVFRPHGKQERL